MSAWRRTAASICALTMLISAGCSDDDGATPDVTSPTTEPTSDAYPMSSSVWVGSSGVEPPPGGLVDSVANFGWTPGEFSVSDDGTAEYTVPLWSPTGRGSVTPQLALSYNSGAGNGILGVGWSLAGLSAITWCGRTIAQDGYTDGGHFDGSDALCLGGNRLVPVSPPFSPQTEYRTEAETFARIIGYNTQDNVPDYFEMYEKNGTILTFGRDAQSRVVPHFLIGTIGPSGPALVRPPAATRATTGWVLDRVEDRNGNAATIEYTRTEGDAAEQWWMELRPARINYAPNREIKFIYDMNRPDQLDNFSGGTHTRTAARMRRIEMWGAPEGDDTELLRQYHIDYKTNSITRRSLLTSVTECDRDNTCKASLPFQYSLGSYEFEEVDMDAHSGVAPTDISAAVDVVDVNGDGMSDVVFDDNGRKMLRIARYVPTADGLRVRFGLPRDSGLAANGAMQVVDIDADGRPEVLVEVYDQEQDGWMYQVYRPTFEPGAGSTFTAVPGSTLGKPQPLGATNRQRAYLADLDGSGLPDFIAAKPASTDPWTYQMNTGVSGRNRFAAGVDTSILGGNPISNFAVDTNGDGLTELVSYSTSLNNWKSWGLVPSDIPNEWQVKIRPLNLEGGPTTTHFGDVNGDGLVDSVLPHGLAPDGPSGLLVQLNSGNGFGSPLAARSPPEYNGPPAPGSLKDVGVRIADFNGDGRDDILNLAEHAVYLWGNNGFTRVELNLEIPSTGGSWSGTQVLDIDGKGALDLVSAGADGHLRVYQRTGGVPDLLIGVGNVVTRGRTEITYTIWANGVDTPGTCSYPVTCPISSGPVVASHKTISDYGPNNDITWDTYAHAFTGARADLHGRGWLGFAEHRVTRAGTGASTVTEFDNVTRDAQTNTYPYAHLPRTETHTVRNTNDTATREYRHVTDRDFEIRHHEFGTHTVEERLSIVAEDEHPVGVVRWDHLRLTRTETTYDEFGNPDVLTAETSGGRTLTQDFDYDNDTTAWLLGLTTRTTNTSCTNDNVCSTRETTYDYDDRGNPTVVTVEPDNPAMKLTTTTVFDDVGNVESTTTTDDAGVSRVETFEYSNVDRLYPTATINAGGHRTVLETHSGFGVPLRVTDPNGDETTFRYDRFGRLRETNRSDGGFQHVTHGVELGILFGRPYRQYITTTDAAGGQTTEMLDQLGRTRERRTTTFDGGIATTYTDYDRLGRGVRRTSRPALPGEERRDTVTEYDNRGRVTSVTAPDDEVVRHEYFNLETHTYDAADVHNYTTVNSDGDVGSLHECATLDTSGCLDDDPSSSNWVVTDFEYGPFGVRTKVLSRSDSTEQITHYDTLGRPDRVEMPSSGVTKTSYNAFGEIVSVTDAENRVTTFDEYDALGRVTKRTSPDGVTTYTWDTAAHGRGKLAEARSADGVTTGYAYDGLGRPATTTWTIDGERYEFAYGYDDVGRPACTTYPMLPGATGAGASERLSVGAVYNARGYLAQVKNGCEPGGEMYWAAETRNSAGQLERERFGNGVVTSRVYRPDTGLLDSIHATIPDAAGAVVDIGYDYDANHNVTELNDLVRQRFETYHYDVLNRLDGWSTRTSEEGSATDTIYTYSPVGDLKTETMRRPDQAERITTYRYGENGASAHWLTSRNDETYGYNRTGQQISGPNRTVKYNTSGLPTELNWNSGERRQRTEFAYDPGGARVLKRDADQTVVTVGGLFERRAPAGSGDRADNLHNIIVEGRVVAQLNRTQDASGGLDPSTQVTYLHSDLQGSTVAVTDESGAPAIFEDPSTGELLYDPFGRRLDAENDPLNGRRDGPRSGFTGHEHDDEFGLINMKGRIYDPESRRFLTPDPIQAPTSSQTYNRYSYVLNNPATLTDPTGYLPPTPDVPSQYRLPQQTGSDRCFSSLTDEGCGFRQREPIEADPFRHSEPEIREKGARLRAGLSATPTTPAAAPSPNADDDTAKSAVTAESQQTTIKGSGDGEPEDTSLWNTVKTGSDVVGLLSVFNILEHTPVGKGVAFADFLSDLFLGVPLGAREVAGADGLLQVAVGSVSLGAAVVEKSAGVLAEGAGAFSEFGSLVPSGLARTAQLVSRVAGAVGVAITVGQWTYDLAQWGQPIVQRAATNFADLVPISTRSYPERPWE